MRKAGTITNVEVADCMLRAGGPVTVKRIVELLKEFHPTLEIDVTFIRARLAAFERSPNVICIVDKDSRPTTYHMLSVTQEFFRGTRHGVRPVDFTHTIIPKKRGDAESCTPAFCIELWNRVTRRRYEYELGAGHHAIQAG